MTAFGDRGKPRVRVCLLIRQLNLGGAQRQLLALALGFDPTRYQVTVMTFYPEGVFAESLGFAKHIDVRCLHKKSKWETISFYARTVSQLRQLQPDIIYSFLGGGNLLAAACRPWLGGVKIIWGIRGSGLEWHNYDWRERVTAKLEAVMSGIPQAIICNSQVGLMAAASRGLQKSKLRFVPNGINCDEFRPVAAISETRLRWGVEAGEVVLGLVGRADPMKDHATCFRAVRILRDRGCPVRLQMIGHGSAAGEAQLRRQADVLGVGEWCGWEPWRLGMSPAYSAFDVLVLSSAYGEGFPNVVAEAMACGTPCVVTKVGDAGDIVGSLGEIVPPRDPLALADGIQRILGRLAERPSLRQEVRSSITARFSTERMVQKTIQIFENG